MTVPPGSAVQQTPALDIIPVSAIDAALHELGAAVIDIIARTYLDHSQGWTVNPDSHFLRFPDRPGDRIIALPASIDRPDLSVSGLKWISSYPGNRRRGLPRASAVLILNDRNTGYPYAVMEGARISAVRTAASAVLGARWLAPDGKRRTAGSLSINGTGVIARAILEMFAEDDWHFDRILLFDTNRPALDAFRDDVQRDTGFEVCPTCESEARRGDIVVYTTTATTPHVPPDAVFTPNQTLLHVSLRDLSPETIYGCENYFDDIGHCLKANTSPHLTAQRYGNLSFVSGTIADVMSGRVCPSRDKPVVFSPFGMGILDLALGHEIYRSVSNAGKTIPVGNFFFEGSAC